MTKFNEKGAKTLDKLIKTQRGLITPPNPQKGRDGSENKDSKKDEKWHKFCLDHHIAPLYENASLENLRIEKAEKLRKLGQEICKNPCNLIITGSSGRGKTYYLHALMREFVEHRPGGIPEMRYFRSLDLDADLLEEIYERKTARYLIRKLAQVKYLFIDDWGTERATEKSERDFLDLIDQRINNQNFTFINTNLKFEDINEHYGVRLTSRLKEYMRIWFDGKDMRDTPKR